MMRALLNSLVIITLIIGGCKNNFEPREKTSEQQLKDDELVAPVQEPTDTCDVPAAAVLVPVEPPMGLAPSPVFIGASGRFNNSDRGRERHDDDDSGHKEECKESESPECGGKCPKGKECIDDRGSCKCRPKIKTCEESSAPTCGGTCPTDEECFDNQGSCQCRPVIVTCAESGAPTCGGTCPTEGQQCQNVSGTCTCQPSCDTAAGPTCGGFCEPGFTCILATGAACACVPSCQLISGECIGGCSLGLSCQGIQGQCSCVQPSN